MEVDFPYVIADAGKLKESVWDACFIIEDDKIMTLGFSGIGIVLKGSISGFPKDLVGELELTVNGKADRS